MARQQRRTGDGDRAARSRVARGRWPDRTCLERHARGHDDGPHALERRRPARSRATSITTVSGSTRQCGAIRARSFCRRAATTTTSAPTPGRRRRRPRRRRDARLLEWALVLPEQRDIGAAALSLQNSGYDVEMLGDDRVIVDPWGTALRLTTCKPSVEGLTVLALRYFFASGNANAMYSACDPGRRRDDDVLTAVDHVGHRRSGLRRGHQHLTHLRAGLLVVGAQHRAARPSWRRSDLSIADHHERLGDDQALAAVLTRARDVDALQRRMIANHVRCLAVRHAATSGRPCRDRSPPARRTAV